ncbi:MAG TPA: DciA family protein [Candidatus Limnocylindria bacterium]|nr:DciA family protein [Candidatus Limnocylindria bacterium]
MTHGGSDATVEVAGVDLARSLLAQAKADARAKGRSGSGSGARTAAARRSGAQTRSGAHPDDRDPQPLAATVRRLVAEHGWEDDVAVGGVVGRWPEIVGADVASHCTPEGWADGVLTVRADSTAWATQVRLLAPQLLRRLAEELGRGTVTRVDVRGPGAPSWVRGPRSVKGRGPRDTYG